jgi:hypothetical protein
MPGACWLMSLFQLTRPKDTPVGYGICSKLGASIGGNSHYIQGDKRNTKIHHFLTITDYIAWSIAFCLHLDGEGGEGERGCASLLGVLIQLDPPGALEGLVLIPWISLGRIWLPVMAGSAFRIDLARFLYSPLLYFAEASLLIHLT